MLNKYWRPAIVTLLLAGDLAAILLSFRFIGLDIIISDGAGEFLQSPGPWLAGYYFALMGAYLLAGLYRPAGNVSRVDELVHILRAVFGLTVIFIVLIVVFNLDFPLSPVDLTRMAIGFVVINLPYRMALRSIQKGLYHYHIGMRRALIVGTSRRAQEINQQITSSGRLGYEVIGFVTDAPQAADPPLKPVVGDTRSLPDLVEALNVDDIVITWENPTPEALTELLSRVDGRSVEILIAPELHEVLAGQGKTEQVYGLPLVRINPRILTPFQAVAKRAIDIGGAILGLIVAAPLMVIVALMVRLTSRGPIIFSQERVGLHGKRFTIYKFRSMFHREEEPSEPVQDRDEAGRISPLGRFLRRLHVDELPQLFNVLRGDMSLVGPRPEWYQFMDWLMTELPFYHRRHLVRPGITGWAQLQGSYETSIEDFKRKLKYDFFYIENLSITLDFKILLMTVWVVLSSKGQ